jgi:hypothetical protein
MTTLIETDARSRVVLPGHANKKFLVHEQDDGSVLLEPARVISEAQYEYDTNAALQELLTRAAQAPTVARPRARQHG